jgi:uncharacterized protein (TIGR02594 family)
VPEPGLAPLAITPFDLARRFMGMEEVLGATSNPAILAMLQMDVKWPSGDDVPWCSAFVNAVQFLVGLPRTKSLAARSWLQVGRNITLDEAEPGFDVIVLSRGAGGHVGYYAGHSQGTILILGGNQGDTVSIAPFDRARLLGVRRILPPSNAPKDVVTVVTDRRREPRTL